MILETQETVYTGRHAFLKPTLEGVAGEDWPHLWEAERTRRHRHAGGGGRQRRVPHHPRRRTGSTILWRLASVDLRGWKANAALVQRRLWKDGFLVLPGCCGFLDGHWMMGQFVRSGRRHTNLERRGGCHTGGSYLRAVKNSARNLCSCVHPARMCLP